VVAWGGGGQRTGRHLNIFFLDLRTEKSGGESTHYTFILGNTKKNYIKQINKFRTKCFHNAK
jgi:hypothetical protein